MWVASVVLPEPPLRAMTAMVRMQDRPYARPRGTLKAPAFACELPRNRSCAGNAPFRGRTAGSLRRTVGQHRGDRHSAVGGEARIAIAVVGNLDHADRQGPGP